MDDVIEMLPKNGVVMWGTKVTRVMVERGADDVACRGVVGSK